MVFAIPLGLIVAQAENKPIENTMKQRFSIKFISLGILGVLSLTGGGMYLFNSQSKFNPFSSCPSTYESSVKTIHVWYTNYGLVV